MEEPKEKRILRRVEIKDKKTLRQIEQIGEELNLRKGTEVINALIGVYFKQKKTEGKQ